MASLQDSVDDLSKVHENITAEPGGRVIRATQEDIDFLIAFEADSFLHLIFLEAKGVTGWTNKQMNSKVARLTSYFGVDGNMIQGARPKFGIISPRPSERLSFKAWPAWMNPHQGGVWLPLPISAEPYYQVERCHENGTTSKLGSYWKTVRR